MAGPDLDVRAFPAYILALEQNRALDASDAQNDPRTRELTEGYLVPLGITSMLEATVRMDTGELVGVVCHEHVGPIRQWVLDEKSFAASIADMVTSALTDDRRRRLTAALARTEERYRTYVSISTEAILGAEFDPPVQTDLPLEQQADEVTARAVIVECNQALARMLGAGSTELLRGQAIAKLPRRCRAPHRSRMGAGKLLPERARIPDYDDRRPVAVGTGSNVGIIKNGAATGLWSTWRDIMGARGRSPSSSIRRDDPLTGLPNRVWLAEQLSARIAESAANGERLALLMMTSTTQGDQRRPWASRRRPAAQADRARPGRCSMQPRGDRATGGRRIRRDHPTCRERGCDPRDRCQDRRSAARAVPDRDAASGHRRVDRRGDLS
jgi:PAS domain-containing protein